MSANPRSARKKPSVNTAAAEARLQEAAKNAAKLSESSITLIIDFTNTLVETEFARVEIARRNLENESTLMSSILSIILIFTSFFF